MDDSSSSAARTLPQKPDLSRTKPESAPLLQAIRGWLRHTLGSKPDASLKEMLEEAIEEHEEIAEERLAPEERIMLHNVLSFGEIQVGDIMVPRTDIAAVPHDISWKDLTAHITEMRHTRIPVYQDALDKMLGFIHVKDLLSLLTTTEGFQLTRHLRPLLFVPPSMRVIDLLVMMRQAGSHMAVVVDEYGGTDGLVTMEDVFEELVGDIQDEHDEDEAGDDEIHRISPTTFEVSARITIEALESELNLILRLEQDEADYDTLGGLIFFQLGRVPVRGEIVRHASGIRFEIIEADPRRIRRVRILTASQAA